MKILNEQPKIVNRNWIEPTKFKVSPKPTSAEPTPAKMGEPTTKQQTRLPIPKELGDAAGVKKFQDFVLASQHFEKDILGPSGADSIWGPKTKAAWDRFGDMYIKHNVNKHNISKDGSQKSTINTDVSTTTEDETKKIMDFFNSAINKGQFKNGEIKKLPTNQIVYAVPADKIEDDPHKVGTYVFLPILSGNTGEWIQFANKKEIDNGTYKLDDIVFNESSINEQKILSRNSDIQKITNKKTEDNQRPDKINELKKYLTAVGIFYDEKTGLPHGTVQLDVIYDNIMQLMKTGWQSKYFYYFKMVLGLLRELYPTKYTFITEEVMDSLKNNVVGQVPENYPGNFNQLSDPANKQDVNVWEISPLNKQISQLSRNNDNIYRWRNFSKGLQPNTDYTGEYTFNSSDPNIGNKCWTALKRWYTTYTDGKSPNQEDKKVTQQFLLQCNNGCVFTNADEKGGLFKTKENYQKVDRMIEELRNLRGDKAKYRIPFDPVQATKEKCKSRGKTMRSANMNDSIEKSLKKLVNENLKEVKLRKKRLIKEEKIISNRLSVLFERKLETQKDYNKLFDSLISESKFLHENGFDENLIKENWFQFLGKLGFGGVADMLQEKFMGWILEKFGVTKGSVTYDLLTLAFGNLDLDNIVSILSGNCSALTKLVSKTIVETLITRMGRKVTKSESGGALEGIVRNAIDEYLTKDKDGLIASLEDKLAQFICPSISKVSDKFSGVAANLKNSVMGA